MSKISNYIIVNKKRLKVQKSLEKVFIVDCGSRDGKFYIFDSKTRKINALSKEDFLNFPLSNPNAEIIIEYAHFRTKETSKAQMLTAEEKEQFLLNCKNSNVIVKFFPNNKTRKARLFAAKNFDPLLEKKSESADITSIYLYLKYFKNIYNTLSSNYSAEDPIIEEAREFREKTTEILDSARFEDYSANSAISIFIEKHKDLLFKELSEETKDFFGIKKNRNGIKIEKIKYVYTIISSLIDEEGNKRLRTHTRKLPGWKFVSNREFCLNANKGSVSKSNLNLHFVRHYLGKKLPFLKNGKSSNSFKKLHELSIKEYEIFLIHRRRTKKFIKELFVLCKNIIQNEIHCDILI